MSRRMSPEDRFDEWLLSDHPEAAAERARRRAVWLAEQQEGHGVLARFAERTDADPTAPDSIRRLAETARWLLARAAERTAIERATPEPERLANARQQFETYRHGEGDHAYRYPARYLGEHAARQPVVSDPARLAAGPAAPAAGAVPGPTSNEGGDCCAAG